MNLTVLRYFTAVYEVGSMAKAAEGLSLSRQALSKAIMTLEDELGVALLARKRSGVEATPAGEVLYRHARILLADWNRALEELATVRQGQQAVLRVGYGQMTYNLWEAGHAEAFARAHPEIRFSYEISPPDRLLELLTQGELDLIISNVHGDPETTFSVLLRTLPFFLLVSREDPLAQREELRLEDLAHHPILLSASTQLSDQIRQIFRAGGVEADFRPFPSHDPLTLLRTIRSTGGAYFDTKLHFLYRDLMDGLAVIPFRYDGPLPFPSQEIRASGSRERMSSPILRQYIQYLMSTDSGPIREV